jgi:uncharacterized membrane protein YbhN (UPF0104 family)
MDKEQYLQMHTMLISLTDRFFILLKVAATLLLEIFAALSFRQRELEDRPVTSVVELPKLSVLGVVISEPSPSKCLFPTVASIVEWYVSASCITGHDLFKNIS